jgi:hypothetical protein
MTPQGWNPVSVEQRFVSTSPSSLDEKTRSVNAIISTGQPVARFYGLEVLEISQGSVDTNRVRSGMCPLLDSHQSGSIHNTIGRVTETWIQSGALWAKLVFHQTLGGDLALGMVKRNEVGGCSIGYRVTQWEVRDADGDIIDQDLSYSNAASFTYIAKKFELLEVSICPVVADAGATIRGDGNVVGAGAPDFIRDARTRMETRMRMVSRMSSDGK